MHLIGFITCKNKAEAKKIANFLLHKRLIACANIFSNINSLYWWKGKITEAKEALLIIKTTKKSTEKIFKETKKIHSYELPVIEFFTAKTNKEAKKWIDGEIKCP